MGEARKEVQNAFNMYSRRSTDRNRENLQKAKNKLQQAEGELKKAIRSVEVARHGDSWKLINQITGRDCKERNNQGEKCKREGR